MELREYETEHGRSSFGAWFQKLDATAAAKITTALVRLEHGNTSNVKSVGGGVHELKINFGPGYRVYFGKDGTEIIVLLAGETKTRQQRDIEIAQGLWQAYKARKKGTA